MKKYIGPKELAEKWGVTERRVRLMCQDGRIEGATKLGWSWSIPADVKKPTDGRHMRKYKASFVRLGSIDITKLNALKEENPLQDKLYTNVKVDPFLSSLICLGSLMDGNAIERESISSVFAMNPARNLPYERALMLTAFRSIFLRACDRSYDWQSRTLLTLHSAFTQGYDDRAGGSYRVDMILPTDAKEEVRIDQLMETFFMQYDREWKNIHPVFKAVLLFSQLVRVKPFERDNCLFALLATSAMLLGEGFLPPELSESDLNEINATLALVQKRGNYEDLARVFERCIISSYSTLFQAD